MADRRIPLPAVDYPDMRLGRHVNHDPRSLSFLVAPPTARVTPKSVSWKRHVAPFNQGDLGSCTINALLGALSTSPYWETLSTEMQQALQSGYIQENLVQPLYREETRLDPFDGAWEPDDTGSDGLSAAKTAKAHGWISGYQHATSLAASHVAIQQGPFIAGVAWTNDMFNPNAGGVVVNTGALAGGHEIVCDAYDLTTDLWWFTNSWSSSWGRNGRFAMSSVTFQKLLADQGDVTSFVPNTSPPPVPNPPPVPDTPKPGLPVELLDKWAARTAKSWPKYESDAAKAYTTWRNS